MARGKRAILGKKKILRGRRKILRRSSWREVGRNEESAMSLKPKDESD